MLGTGCYRCKQAAYVPPSQTSEVSKTSEV